MLQSRLNKFNRAVLDWVYRYVVSYAAFAAWIPLAIALFGDSSNLSEYSIEEFLIVKDYLGKGNALEVAERVKWDSPEDKALVDDFITNVRAQMRNRIF